MKTLEDLKTIDPAEIAKKGAEALLIQFGHDPKHPGGLLDRFLPRVDTDLHTCRYDDIPAALNELHQLLLKVTISARPDPHQLEAEANAFYSRGSALNIPPEELDAAVAAAKPSKIVALEFDRIVTADGRTIMRTAIRERMRTAAFSDEGWRRFVGSLPKIEAPKDHVEND
ncbi:MAG: hypothetical protein ABSC63_13090 [Candidatus Binataceae bacterium]|jgi:hypothetical protein